MRMRVQFGSWMIALAVLGWSSASAQVIGFAQTSSHCDGLNCHAALQLRAGESATFNMHVDLSRHVEDGISAVEFSVTGLPAGWTAVIEPAAGATVSGNPFHGGTVVTFDACQVIDPGPPEDRQAVLFDVTLQATSEVGETWMFIRGHDSVGPHVTDCAFPNPTVIDDVGVDALVLNPGRTLAVEDSPWGRVKALYSR